MLALLLATALAGDKPPNRPAPMLGPADLDPALVLPPPPAPDSAQARAELAELKAMEATRTPAAELAARLDGDTKNATIFAAALGPGFDLDRLPATARLMGIVRATEKAAADRGKDKFRRMRPITTDPTLHACKTEPAPLSSYPSGHSSMAFAMAGVLARLMPTRAPALLARAAVYAQSRIVCEQHWRSDVTAGEALGLLVAERLMTRPAFLPAFADARAELARAGLPVSPAAAR